MARLPSDLFQMRWTLAVGTLELVTFVWRSCKKDVKGGPARASRGPSGLRGEPVADPGVGVDETAAGKGTLELRPEPPYIYIDGAVALPI